MVPDPNTANSLQTILAHKLFDFQFDIEFPEGQVGGGGLLQFIHRPIS